MFENGGLMRGAMDVFATRKGPDGLSHVEREEQRQQKVWDKLDRQTEAELLRNVESDPIPCFHDPECPGELCKDCALNGEIQDRRYSPFSTESIHRNSKRERQTAITFCEATSQYRSHVTTKEDCCADQSIVYAPQCSSSSLKDDTWIRKRSVNFGKFAKDGIA